MRLTVNLDEQSYSALLVIAKREDAPLAWVIRKAVMELIDSQAVQEPELPLARGMTTRQG